MGCQPVAVVIMHVHKYEIKITNMKYAHSMPLYDLSLSIEAKTFFFSYPREGGSNADQAVVIKCFAPELATPAFFLRKHFVLFSVLRTRHWLVIAKG